MTTRSPRGAGRPGSARRPAGRQWPALLSALGLVPALVLLLCSVSADEVAITGGDPLGVWSILPAGPVAGGWLSAELSSTALLLLAIALARGKRLGFWLGLAAMGGAVLVQGVELRHPVAAVGAVVLSAILVATRARYDVASDRRNALFAIGLLAFGGLAVGAAAYEAAQGTGAWDTAADAVGSLFDLATPLPLPGLAALGALVIVARLAVLVATVLALEPAGDERPPEVVAAARRALRRLGSGSLLPYQEDAGCIPRTDVDERAVLVTARAGRVDVAIGGPSGELRAGRALLAAWAAAARRCDHVPVVYQASTSSARALRRAGWTACLVGREALIDPVAFDLRSAGVANLRHTVSRARRGGLTTIVSHDGVRGLPSGASRMGLLELDRAWRRRAGPQLGFTVGRFDPDDPRPSLLVAAVDGEGHPHAFAVLRATGADGGWMLDVIRRADGGVPGAVELAVVTAVERLAATGVRRLSLGLAPLDGLSIARGSIAERALAVAAWLVRPAYDARGLAFFKQKFDPRWERRLLVAPSPWQLGPATLALLRLHLGGSWPRVLRSLAAGVAARG